MTSEPLQFLLLVDESDDLYLGSVPNRTIGYRLFRARGDGRLNAYGFMVPPGATPLLTLALDTPSTSARRWGHAVDEIAQLINFGAVDIPPAETFEEYYLSVVEALARLGAHEVEV